MAKYTGEVLALDKVGATDDFFEMGGTSLMVTRVIIEADKKGYHIAYGDIFSNPTARELAKNINGNGNENGNGKTSHLTPPPSFARLSTNGAQEPSNQNPRMVMTMKLLTTS